jgi:hypothetical protein
VRGRRVAPERLIASPVPSAEAQSKLGPREQGRPGDFLANINLVAAMAYGRAGSILMQSLFDGHPVVLTLPHLGAMYSLIPASINDLDAQLDWFIATFPSVFDTSRGGYFSDSNEFVAAKFGPDGTEDLHVSEADFKHHARSVGNEFCLADGNRRISRKEFFVLVHVAYGLCVRSFEVSAIRYIFYHTHAHVQEEWQCMLEDFPGLYFIGMTRDPRQDWASWKKIHASRMQRPIADVPPVCLFLSEYYYSKSTHDLSHLVENLQNNRIRLIDLEQLHILNKAAMTHLCSWLNIEFDECLLQSTFNGRQWHGNAANGKRLPAFNPNMTRDAWRSTLSDEDRKIVCYLVPSSIRYFGYDEDNPIDPEENDHIVDCLKYRSSFALFIDCTLYLSGNPITRFYKAWRNPQTHKVRAVLSLGAAYYRGARLFFELKGDRLERKMAEIKAQQKELSGKPLPSRLISYVPH